MSQLWPYCSVWTRFPEIDWLKLKGALLVCCFTPFSNRKAPDQQSEGTIRKQRSRPCPIRILCVSTEVCVLVLCTYCVLGLAQRLFIPCGQAHMYYTHTRTKVLTLLISAASLSLKPLKCGSSSSSPAIHDKTHTSTFHAPPSPPPLCLLPPGLPFCLHT